MLTPITSKMQHICNIYTRYSLNRAVVSCTKRCYACRAPLMVRIRCLHGPLLGHETKYFFNRSVQTFILKSDLCRCRRACQITCIHLLNSIEGPKRPSLYRTLLIKPASSIPPRQIVYIAPSIRVTPKPWCGRQVGNTFTT